MTAKFRSFKQNYVDKLNFRLSNGSALGLFEGREVEQYCKNYLRIRDTLFLLHLV